MKFLSFILLLTLYTKTAEGQNTLSGRITEKATGSPVVGAVLYIPDLKRNASTDPDGKYSFPQLPSGRFIIEVHMTGFSSLSRPVLINGNTAQDFVLEESHVELNQVVVTGVSHATEIKRNPVPIVVVDQQYINRNLSTNLMDALSRTPGINTVTTGPNVSKPFIRGLGYNRILTLFDGIRQEGQQWGDEHGIEIDEYMAEKIEVVKGPASLIYGSDALAGVVNMLPPPPVEEGKILGNILANYQTNNGLFAGSASLSGNNKGISWMTRYTHKQATDYQNKIDGRVYGTAFNENDFSASASVNKAWGYSHLGFSLFDNLQEIPDGSRDSVTRRFTKQISEIDTFRPVVSDKELQSYSIAPLHQHVQHYRLYSNNNFLLGNAGKLAVNLGYQQSIRREYSHPEYTQIPGLYLDLKSLTYDVKYFLPEIKGWEPSIGINGMYQNNYNRGSEFIIPDYYSFDFGPFAYVKKTFAKLDISAGIRYDQRIFRSQALYTKTDPVTGLDTRASLADTGLSMQFGAYNHIFYGISGSIGATYNFTDQLSVKANVARGYRAPNISEIAANGVHPGTNIYQIGNPDFNPEFSLQEDVGFFFNSRHLSLGVELFNNDISNYIYNQKVLNSKGQDSVIVPGSQTFRFVAAHAQLYGGELSIDLHPHPLDWLHFENSLSVVYALNRGGEGVIITDEEKYLPFIPPVHTISELRANFKKRKGYFSNTYIKIEVEHYEKQDRVLSANNTETPTPGYTLLNAGIGSDFVNKNGKTLISVHLLGNNLTDAAYQSHLSRLKYFEPYPGNYTGHNGIYNMGRNISLKVIVPISLKS